MIGGALDNLFLDDSSKWEIPLASQDLSTLGGLGRLEFLWAVDWSARATVAFQTRRAEEMYWHVVGGDCGAYSRLSIVLWYPRHLDFPEHPRSSLR